MPGCEKGGTLFAPPLFFLPKLENGPDAFMFVSNARSAPMGAAPGELVGQCLTVQPQGATPGVASACEMPLRLKPERLP